MSDHPNPAFQPKSLSGSNLSHLWARALLHISRSRGDQIAPLIVSIHGFNESGLPNEDEEIRSALDEFLLKNGDWSIEIVAFTIFPRRYLQIADGDRKAFYKICRDALPYIKARNRNLNGHGLYFERLINFGKAKHDDNQLEFMITEYLENRKRTSKFQASIYDPVRDQSKQPYQTFPCLQTVSFVATRGVLVVNGFYALQYLMQRAYGNFLGLCHLGAFMAHEMKLPLAQVNIVVGVEQLEYPKRDVQSLVDLISKKVPELVRA